MSSTRATRFKDCGFSFCLPYNNDTDWLDRLCNDYADITHNVYVPLHPSVFPSLYLDWRGGEPEAYHEQFMELYQRLASAGIRTNILLNSNIPASTRFDDLFAYFDKWLDTRWMMVSVMNFHLARQLRQRYPGLYITASLSAAIENPTAAPLLEKRSADRLRYSLFLRQQTPRTAAADSPHGHDGENGGEQPVSAPLSGATYPLPDGNA